MPSERILTNATVVTANEVFRGTVVIRNGRINDMAEGSSHLPRAENLGGDYLLPGLVELHTDNLEKYMMPRPGVDWPSRSAVLTHDAQIVSSGITTVFDALSIGEVTPGSKRLQKLPLMLEAIEQSADQGNTRADHRLHLRCEVSHPETVNIFCRLVDNPLVRLVSVMDHAPGQRQFVNLEKYREYYQGKYQMNDQEMETFMTRQIANSRDNSERSRSAIVDACHRRGLSIASHDDATEDHVRESAAFGMSIAEFPTTALAARASHSHGLKVLMGAPNIVRGGSHSGNVAAAELADNGVLDILSSDYYPSSLLHAAFILAARSNEHKNTPQYDLPGAIATVSRTPAQAAGFDDRGEIRIGLRADLLQASATDHHPVVRQVWRAGQRVF